MDAATRSLELAALDILQHTAGVARAALIAAHLELQEGDFVASVLLSRSIPACCADAVVTHLDALDSVLTRYRELLATHRAPPVESNF